MKYILITTLLIAFTAGAAPTSKKTKAKKRRTTISKPARPSESPQSVQAPGISPVPEATPVSSPSAPPSEAASSVTEKPKTKSKLRHWSFVTRGLFWQEDLEATELGEKSKYHSQLMGLSFGLNRTNPFSSRRWVPFYTLSASFGTLKSAGVSAGHVDSFKNQPWYMATADLGVSYRPSANSEIRLVVPLQYRMIQWKTSRSTLEMGQKSPYTTGLGIVSATQMASGSYILTGFTHLYQWNATLWHAGFEFIF